MTQTHQPLCECVTTCGDCRKTGEKCGGYKVDLEGHPDDAAVDALAAAMKAKLAKQRAKGYGGWDTDCTQQRLSDMLRNHVDKGDPVDAANFCAFLLARGEGIAAAPQAVQPAAPMFWVRLLRDGQYEGPVHNNSAEGKLLRDEKPAEWHPLYLQAAPAHPAEGVPAPMPVAHPHHCTARTVDGSCEECEGHSQAMAEWNAERTALAATQPAAQGLEADGMYYLQDARWSSMVGNCPSFWRPDGNGYTTNLDEAARFTFEDAMKQHQCRETDLPWLCTEVDKLRRPTVDCQYMPRSWDTQRAALAAQAKQGGA